MPDRIYLIDERGDVSPLDASDYARESQLQELLAKVPALLAGGESTDDGWLLVRREMQVPDSDESDGRWSIDHLFLDRMAVPTLVEVKRSSDTRIRREVVGQMLDYAANSVAFWSIDTIRSMYEKSCEAESLDPAARVLELLMTDDDAAVEAFWERVKTNLEAQKLRLVFVADVIPPELRRIIEFLNGQMDPVEVLGIELPQFVKGDSRVLVPHVIGRTTQAEQKKRTRPAASSERWTEQELLAAIEANCGAAERRAAESIFERLSAAATEKSFSSKSTEKGLISFGYRTESGLHRPIRIYASGAIELMLSVERTLAPFSDVGLRQEWLSVARRIPGFEEKGGLDGLPVVRLPHLTDPASLEQFMKMVDWLEEQLGVGR